MDYRKRTLFLYSYVLLLIYAIGLIPAPSSSGVDQFIGAGGSTQILASEFVAKVDGSQVVPTFGTTNAEGSAEFSFSRDTLDYTINATNVKDVTEVHVHKGFKGENGPVIANLKINPDYAASNTISSGNLNLTDVSVERWFQGPLQGKGETVFDVLEQAMMNNQTYVDIHTKQHPDGEIRGDIFNGMFVSE